MPSVYQLAAVALLGLLPLVAFALFTSVLPGRPGATALAARLACCVFALWGVRFMADRVPPASRPLGTLMDVSVDAGTLSPPVSVVETSGGFYAVRGAVSAPRGAAVTQRRGSLGTVRVCIADACYPVPGSR